MSSGLDQVAEERSYPRLEMREVVAMAMLRSTVLGGENGLMAGEGILQSSKVAFKSNLFN